MLRAKVFDKGGIEQDYGSIQIVFANKSLGGGALGLSLLQEEIRWLTNPELFLQRLFYEELDNQEASIVHGANQYCELEGYNQQCQFKDEFYDKTPCINEYSDIAIVSIDAEMYQNKKQQFKFFYIMRELKKCYAGFALSKFLLEDKDHKKPIATGKWGCGAFNGDPQLKFILQWIAASESDRELHFYTYNDFNLKRTNAIVETFKNYKVSQVIQCIKEFSQEYIDNYTLFDYILDFVN